MTDDGGSRALLRRLIGIFSQGLDLDHTVAGLVGVITEVTGTDVCFVHILDEQRRRLVLTGGTPPFDQLARTIELAVGEGVAGWVAQHGKPAVVDDKWTDPRYKYIPELRGEEFESMMSAPMITGRGHLVGVLNVHARQQRTFSPEDVSLLVDVANLLAGALENARLYTRLAEREVELEAFAKHTLELQESERKRLAAELHDGISQRMVSLYYHLCAATEAQPPPSPSVVTQLTAARDLAAATLEEARVAIHGLHPPLLDDLGLGACLRELVHTLPTTVATSVEVDDCTLDAHVEVAIYRMAQEALQNALKHAQASRVAVELRARDGVVLLTIGDDGRGFDVGEFLQTASTTRHGIAGLRARAELIGATLAIDSAPGEGTTLRIVVPVGAARGVASILESSAG